MWLSVAVKYLRLSWNIFLSNVSSAMSFRVAFLLHITGLSLFYIGNFWLWIIFFKQFSSVNGWGMANVSLVSAIFIFSYSVVDSFAGGVTELARIICSGGLDYFLVFPKPILWHIAVSRSDVTSIFSGILSLGMFWYSGDITLCKTALFLLASCFSAILFFNFLVISQSIAFFVGNIEYAALESRYFMATVSRYPFSMFPSPFKYVFMIIIPSFFVVTLPANLVESFSLTTLAILVFASVASSFLAYFVFTKGLKRYESGNLVTVRM